MMANGNGVSVNRVERLETHYQTNMFAALRQKAVEVKDAQKRAMAEKLFKAESVEEVVEHVEEIQRGSWVDNLVLAGSSIVGVVAGYAIQGMVDARQGPVPMTGLLGLAGVVPGLVMKRTLTARNAVGLGGAMFIAGAGLYAASHPASDGEGEPGQVGNGG